MKATRIIMDMPVTVEINDTGATNEVLADIFAYFHYIDNKFSTFKATSEISLINYGLLKEADYSADMQTILKLAEITKSETGGYFDIRKNNGLDPSGIVKGWAINEAAKLLRGKGFRNFYIEAGGDIQTSGTNSKHESWTVGIRNPFNTATIVKKISVSGLGVATSGTYERGKHIYNPKQNYHPADDLTSLTVIGPDIYEADRFATAAFAMGKPGIFFLENLKGFEGYMIDKTGVATFTRGLAKLAV